MMLSTDGVALSSSPTTPFPVKRWSGCSPQLCGLPITGSLNLRVLCGQKEQSVEDKNCEIVWQATYDGVVSPNPDKKRHSADAKRDRVLNAPALVYVYSLHGENNQMTLENYATSCCAVQNMALAAVAEDLYLDWSTGGLT